MKHDGYRMMAQRAGERVRLITRNGYDWSERYPAVVKGDQGPQDISIDTSMPLNGAVLFRVLPGGGPNFDWGYWAKIDVH